MIEKVLAAIDEVEKALAEMKAPEPTPAEKAYRALQDLLERRAQGGLAERPKRRLGGRGMAPGRAGKRQNLSMSGRCGRQTTRVTTGPRRRPSTPKRRRPSTPMTFERTSGASVPDAGT